MWHRHREFLTAAMSGEPLLTLTALQVSRLTHRESYFDMVMTVAVSTIVASTAIIVLGSVFGSF